MWLLLWKKTKMLLFALKNVKSWLFLWVGWGMFFRIGAPFHFLPTKSVHRISKSVHRISKSVHRFALDERENVEAGGPEKFLQFSSIFLSLSLSLSRCLSHALSPSLSSCSRHSPISLSHFSPLSPLSRLSLSLPPNQSSPSPPVMMSPSPSPNLTQLSEAISEDQASIIALQLTQFFKLWFFNWINVAETMLQRPCLTWK